MDHETGLHPLIERNLGQMGYAQPRPIQSAVRDKALAGRDIIGLAATGSGKTAAFVAPVLHVLLANRPGGNPATRRDKRPINATERLRALILCPTRELAQQVQKETGLIAQGSVLRTASAVGKSAISPQVRAIERGVDVLIATPGRAIELLENGVLSLAHLRFLIIDEGDRMLDMGFLPQIEKILQRVGTSAASGRGETDAAPRMLQIMLFSATMPAAMEDLARKFLHVPGRIEIGRHTTPVSHIQQRLIPVRHEHKVSLLLHMLGAGDAKPAKRQRGADGVLIFCATRRRVGWVGNALERHGLKVGMLHGDRSQAQRQKALEGFREGALRVLVATDVAARGLHIPAVKTVINYDLPQQPEEYVHRVGRAAHGVEEPRVGDKPAGEAFTLLDSDERVKWRSIVDTTGIRVFAEHEVPGWSPPKPMSRGGKPRRDMQAAPRQQDAKPRVREHRSAATTTTATATAMDRRPLDARKQRAGFDPFNRPPRKRGRTHASKPIKKGQKPGGGVKR